MVLQDLLEPLNRLSLFLQREETTLADAYMMMESTKDNILTYGNDCSSELSDVCDSGMLNGRKLHGQKPTLAFRPGFVQALSDSLENRFSADETLINATKIANFSIWPPTKEKERIHEFGFEEVKFLVTHFSSKFSSVDALQREWRSLKSLLYKRYSDSVQTLTWSEVNAATEGQGVSSILTLFDLILSLPPTSVFNERSFSHMKLIKSERRGRMSTSTLSDIVKSETPDVKDFDPTEAISSWLITPSGRPRRPNFQRKKRKQHMHMCSQEETGNETTQQIGKEMGPKVNDSVVQDNSNQTDILNDKSEQADVVIDNTVQTHGLDRNTVQSLVVDDDTIQTPVLDDNMATVSDDNMQVQVVNGDTIQTPVLDDNMATVSDDNMQVQVVNGVGKDNQDSDSDDDSEFDEGYESDFEQDFNENEVKNFQYNAE